MDALAEFLPLIFLVLYYLLAARRKAAQRERERKPAPQQELISETRAPTPFQSFLAELEQAMAEANGAAPPPAPEAPPPRPEPPPVVLAPVVPPQPVVERLRPSLGPEFRAVGGSFDAPEPVDHERHGFGQENPLSEETFERQGPQPRRRERYDPHALHTPSAPAPGAGLFAHLDDPATARQAFVLQTVFGPRGGRRADRR